MSQVLAMKKYTLLSLLIVFFFTSYAQFGERQYISDAISVSSIEGADLDNDGLEDIVIVGIGGLAWLKNIGTSTDPVFTDHQLINDHLEYSFTEMYIKDFNNDGFLDVVAANPGDDLIVYFRNLGDGDFTDGQIVSDTGNFPSYIAFGDVDGDEDEDMMVYFQYDDEIILFKNSGNFFGGPIYVIDPWANMRSLDLIDGDGDGDLDMLYSSNTGIVRYAANDGSGNFPFLYSGLLIGTNAGYSGLHTADFDNDGDQDVLMRYPNNSQPLAIIENLGAGNYADTVYINTTNVPSKSIILKDVDDDGFVDIVGLPDDAGEVMFLKNEGGLVFSPGLPIYSAEASIVRYGLHDFNNDDNLDVIQSITGNLLVGKPDDIVYAENNEDPESVELVYKGAISNLHVVAGDVDGDGLKDVVTPSTVSDAFSWFKNLGGGQFSDKTIIYLAENPKDAYLDDLDGDGDLDLITSSTGAGVLIHENLGGGNFSPNPISLDGTANFVQTFDIDGDGDPDILTGSSTCLYNQGDLSFSSPVDLSDDFFTFSRPVTVDIDLDGDLDIIGANTNQNRVHWLENVGTSDFVYHLLDNNFDSPFNIYPADFNGDGFPELVVGSRDDENISWFVNNGDGNFQSREIILAGIDYPRGIFIIDADIDGDNDIITNAPDDDQIILFSNLGNGTFASPQIIEDNYFSFFTLPVDLDNDFDLDLISVGGDGNIRWYENSSFSIGAYALEIEVFVDENENGIKDEDEILLQNFPIVLAPDALQTYSSAANNNSSARFLVNPGTYTISPELADCWALTSTNDQFVISVTDNSPLVQSFQFGVKPNNTDEVVSASLTAAAPTRCGFTVPYYLSVTNQGCNNSGGTYGFLPSDLVNVETSIPPVNEVINDTLFWDFSDLEPNATQQVYLELQIADASFIGEIIDIPVSAYLDDGTGALYFADAYQHLSEINCAYDPNDKQVSPARSLGDYYSENYTLFEEELEYTVRFQNTGTDTAFNVIIRDQLSSSLDWSTFIPKAASHNYTASLNANGQVTFTFENILLPDSTTNEIASHGFVNFSIYSKQDLANYTSIVNSAGIYFDFNPPILTNQVENIMVDPLPLLVEADFSYSSEFSAVVFQDESLNDPVSWYWDFGNGITSILQNPSIIYTMPGEYEVCLIAENIIGTDTTCQLIEVFEMPPVVIAGFSYESDLLEVDFQDESQNDPISWQWDFGDGQVSDQQNPLHTFPEAGNYTVCLTVENSTSMDMNCQQIEVIESFPAVTAAFSYESELLEVTFTDNSINDPTSWLWDFGDGATSQDQNPVYTYVDEGGYTVCLTVENSNSDDMTCQEVSLILTSVNEVNDEQYEVFPNPTKSTTIIQFPFLIDSNGTFTLFKSNGSRINPVVEKRADQIVFDASNMNTGLWFFEFKQKDRLIIGKVVIVK